MMVDKKACDTRDEKVTGTKQICDIWNEEVAGTKEVCSENY